MLSVDLRSKVLTLVKIGLRFSMTQQLGDILTSQSVKAYRASIVLSEELPGANWTTILASSAVKSSTLRILIFPLSWARKMVSIILEVVVP